ncbi:acyltransferase family protein [Kineococcus sp. SYSU DK006]|uniref:acyltransferase family protein n=1 Tax=Kineococcus sp. SYSU DK006 TaxID=3383127 RepID=UPI003D7D24E5
MPAPVAVRAAATRLDWVDVAKGLAILGVVAYHAGLFLTPLGLVDGWQADATRVVALSASLPLFFFASGLFAQRLLTDSFGELFRRRLWPLLHLYVLWSTVRFAVFQFVPWVLPTSDPSDWREPALMLVLPNGGLWFLYALVLYSIAAWASRRSSPAVLLTVAAVVSVLFTSGVLSTGNTGWDKTGANVFWFFAALHLRERVLERVARLDARAAFVSTAAFVVVAGALVADLLPLGRLVAVGLAPLAVVAGVSLSTTLAGTRTGRPLRHLGERTLAVYLVHYLPIAVACGVLSTSASLVAAVSPATPALPLVLTVAATALSLLAWRLLGGVPGVFSVPGGRPRRERVEQAVRAPAA